MRRSRIILLLLLPFLLWAIWIYATTCETVIRVRAVQDNGQTLIYSARPFFGPADWRNSLGSLIRRTNGETRVFDATNLIGKDSADQLFDQYDSNSECLVVDDRIYCVTKDHYVVTLDSTNFSFVGAPIKLRPLPPASEQNLFYVADIRLAATKNRKYLACMIDYSNRRGRYEIVDLVNSKRTWIEDINSDTYFMDSRIVEFRGSLFEFESGQPIALSPKLWEEQQQLISPASKWGIKTDDGEQNRLWISDLTHPDSEPRPVPIEGNIYEFHFSQDEIRLIISGIGSLTVVNLPNAKVEHTSSYPNDELPIGLNGNIENDGRSLARVVEPTISFWEYVKFPLLAESPVIDIHDVATGEKIRTVRDHRNDLLIFLVALLGAIAWSFAWVWTSWRHTKTIDTISNVAVLSFLWLAYFFLRLMYGADCFDYDRIPAIGTATLLTSMTLMVSLWAVFAKVRVWLRVAIGSLAIALIWVGPALLLNHFEIYLDGTKIPIDCLVMLILTVSMAAGLRFWGVQLVRLETDELPANESGPEQQEPLGRHVGLIDFFIITMAAAFLMSIAQALQGFDWNRSITSQAYYSLPSILLLISFFGNCWAGLLRYGLFARIGLGTCAIGLAIGCLYFYQERPWQPSGPWYIVIAITIGATAFISVSLIRKAGWRLRWIRPRSLAAKA